MSFSASPLLNFFTSCFWVELVSITLLKVVRSAAAVSLAKKCNKFFNLYLWLMSVSDRSKVFSSNKFFQLCGCSCDGPETVHMSQSIWA